MYSQEQLDFKQKQQPPKRGQVAAVIPKKDNKDKLSLAKRESSADKGASLKVQAQSKPQELQDSQIKVDQPGKNIVIKDDAATGFNSQKEQNLVNAPKVTADQKNDHNNEPIIVSQNEAKANVAQTNNFFRQQSEADTNKQKRDKQMGDLRNEYYGSDESEEAVFENQRILQKKQQLQQEILDLERKTNEIQLRRQQSQQSRNDQTLMAPDFVNNFNSNTRNELSKDSTSFEYFEKDDLTDNPVQSQERLFSAGSRYQSNQGLISTDFKTIVNTRQTNNEESRKDISFLNDSNEHFMIREGQAYRQNLSQQVSIDNQQVQFQPRESQNMIQKSAVGDSLDQQAPTLKNSKNSLYQVQDKELKTISNHQALADQTQQNFRASNLKPNKASEMDQLSHLSSNLEISHAEEAKDKTKGKTSKDVQAEQEEENNAVIPDVPPIPLSYLKYHNKRGGALGGKLMGVVEDEDTQKVYFEPLSYRKLEKIICQLHPVDPETKERFDYKDRVTVDDYYPKISDMCCCYQATQSYKLLLKWLRKKFKIKEAKTIMRPESMQDELSSDSQSSSSNEENIGITQCSQSLGDGASLYLQMMKTLTIMFLILTIVNIPIFVMYEANTSGNALNNYNEVFKYFTIGNLGQMSKQCGFSNFQYRFDKMVDMPTENIKFDCDHGYLGEIQEFGFLYKFDKEWGGQTEGEAVCNRIMDPFFKYRKPEPEPIVCNTDDFADEEEDPGYLICEINRKEQNGEMTQEEAQTARSEFETEEVIEVDEEEQARRQALIWVYEDDVDEQGNQQEKSKYNLDEECMFKGSIPKRKTQKIFKDKKAQEKFVQYFQDICMYNKTCEIDPQMIGYQEGEVVEDEVITQQNAGLFGLISDECKLRMSHQNYQNITSPIYLGVFGCQFDQVKFPLVQNEIHKEVCGVVIVCFDIASIVIMIYFFTKINSINNEFIVQMDNLQVQMKDFGVRIKDVRLDKFTYDSRVIKIKVWLHFREILQPFKSAHNDMECIDVCLSLYTQPSIQCVFRMQEIQLDINDINNKLFTSQYSEADIPDKQDELKVLMEKQKRFELRYKQLTAKRVHTQEDGEMNLVVQRVPRSQKINNVQYVFVIFKNCLTREDVLELFPKESKMMQKIKEKFGMKTLKKENKMMFNRELQIDPILEPDEIIWQNLSYTLEEQQARKYAVDIFSVFFVLANTLFTMYLSYFKTFVNKRIPDPMGCPESEISKEDAYADIKNNYEDDGLWMCYCDQATSIFLPWTLTKTFQEFSEGGEDNTNYCWKFQYMQVIKKVSLFFVSTSAVFINEYVADLYQELGKFQKKHTKNEEQQTCFRMIFIQEFINMGIIVLISSFDRIGMKAKLFPDQAEGKIYQGFEPQWYMDYGKNICIFIFMSSFVVNSKDLGRWFVTSVFRLVDRKGKMNLKQDPEDEDCDKPNSQIRIQKNLELLYTGKGFKGEKSYSRLMSTMFVIQLYSSGMPILYLNGFIFYLVTFLCNKFLLIYYYQKSRTLSRTIPLFTMQYLKYGLLLHMLAACLMLTNKMGFVTREPSGMNKIFDVEDATGQIEDMSGDGSIKVAEQRVEFLHQQLYWIFLIFFFFTYFIGKSFYIFSVLIITGVIQAVRIQAKKALKFSQQQAVQALLDGHQTEIKKESIFKQMKMKFRSQIVKKEEEIPTIDVAENKAHKQIHTEIALDLDKVKQHIAEHEQARVEVANEKAIKLERKLTGSVTMSKSGHSIGYHDEFGNSLDSSERHELIDQKIKERAFKKEQQKMRLSRRDYSENILKELNTENLSNFYDRCQRELTDLWDLFQYNQEITEDDLEDSNKSEYSVLFLETLYTYRITKEECLTYQTFLKKRIRDVEVIIDSHFNLIIPFLKDKLQHSFEADRNRRKKDNKEGTLKDQVAQRKYEEWFFKYSKEIQFDNQKVYTHSKKIKLLVEFQDELIVGDKERKDNKKGEQDICRMKGSLTQSYFIFDAQQYKVGRKIYYGIENEVEKEESIIQDDKSQMSESSSSSSSNSSASQESRVKKKKAKKTPEKKSKKAPASPTRKSPPSKAKSTPEIMSKKSKGQNKYDPKNKNKVIALDQLKGKKEKQMITKIDLSKKRGGQ